MAEDTRRRPFSNRPSRTEDREISTSFIRRHYRTALAATLLLGATIVFLVTHGQQKVPAMEISIALMAATVIHLMDRLWLHREAEESSANMQRAIVDNVNNETQKSIQTLEAMKRSGMLQVYADREQAATHICDSLTNRNTERIRLIGISLNDFFSGRDQDPLAHAWKQLKWNIEHGIAPSRTLDVRVLIIDPDCLGAQLRSRGEERNGQHFHGRLRTQVNGEIEEELMELLQSAKPAGIKFECRLYRLPPILFLCWTDLDCYVQQYYFWASRDEKEKSFPVLRFQNTNSDSLHAELLQHFDWIWQKASISIEEHEIGRSIGVDQGIVQSGIVNVLTESEDRRGRMLYLLKNAKKRVSIQGNSLHSFLNTRPDQTPLYRALKQLVIDGSIDIEILILNPESHPAKFRGYRESTLRTKDVTWRQYESSPTQHHDSILYKDTTDAEDALKQLVVDVAKQKPPGWEPKLTGGKYDSAPYSFLLRVDGTVLVEQYHYGKLPDDGADGSGKLGREVPLVEYSAEPSPIYDLTHKQPYELFLNHFEFALRDAEPFRIHDWLGINR